MRTLYSWVLATITCVFRGQRIMVVEGKNNTMTMEAQTRARHTRVKDYCSLLKLERHRADLLLTPQSMVLSTPWSWLGHADFRSLDLRSVREHIGWERRTLQSFVTTAGNECKCPLITNASFNCGKGDNHLEVHFFYPPFLVWLLVTKMRKNFLTFLGSYTW